MRTEVTERLLPACLLVALLIGASPLPSARAEGLVDVAEAAVTRFVTRMEELAQWCEKQELYAGRDTCCRLLVLYRPDHEIARRTLRYTKRGGEWVQSPGYKPGTNRNEEMEPKFQPWLEEITSEFLNTLLQAVRPVPEWEDRDGRKRVLGEILRLSPDHEEARSLNGEAFHGGRWVLKETKSAHERRRALLEAVKEHVKAVKDPVRDEPDGVEAGLGLPWTAALKGEWWRALGTVSEPELRRVLARMEASDRIFTEVFGIELPREKGCGFYLLRGLPDAKLAIGKHPQFSDTQKAYYLTLRSAWLPRRHVFFQWSDTPEVRVDGSVRNALGIMLMRSFGVNTDRGWVWEGLGCYLVELITGTHRVVYVTRDMVTTTEREAKLDIDRRMKQPGANWLALARELYDAKVAPEMRVFARKKVNDMVPEDLIAGYALARYIVEGRPDQATRFFMLHGNSQPIEETVETVFRMPLALFEQQLTRWLAEML